MASSPGKSTRLALLTTTLGGAVGLGFVEKKMPQYKPTIDKFQRIGAVACGVMAVRGGKHALKWMAGALVLGVPEATDFGRDLGSK